MAFDFPSSPTTGQTYSISGGPTYVYNGTAWVVLTPGNQFNRTVFTATAGQTTFSMNYVVGAIDVYRNGVKLVNTSDFTATNGTSIVLLNAATVGDTVEVISYPMITYSDAVKRTGDTMTGALAVPSLTVNSVPILAGPAFSAYGSGLQSTSNTTYTKTAYNTVEFDTNSNYNTTNRRFTPTVAGYYLINTVVAFSSTATAAARGITAIYKNGSSVRLSSANLNSSTNTNILNSAVIYMNGTTDYIEIFMYQDSGGALNCGSSGLNASFSGCLVRAA